MVKIGKKALNLLLNFSIIILFVGCSSYNHPPLEITSNHSQVIIVEPVSKIVSRLTFWERSNGLWNKIYGPISSVVGRSGIALAGSKREGDGKTPSGLFHLTQAFGYDAHMDTKLPYRQTSVHDFWIDEPTSHQYNLWVDKKPDSGSYEILRRNDDLYRLAVIIDYNSHPIIPGHGSAIFLHIWRGHNKPTSGCVAVNQRHLRNILQLLDKDKNPLILIHDNNSF